nr:hypothetical protein [Tanacetum cinerariifolium]
KGYWDCGCSRHMTGNISYLSEYEPYDGGYVSFGQGGGKITGKDESMMWHRRLGHLNFKTMNKLVRNNLVKGLPSKCFENDHTCVACLKGKQHKASCKTKKGIKREFSNARTPQQNGVAERRNKTLIEVARTMLADAKLPVTFWAEAVNTAYHLGKFDARGDEGYFVGYSMTSKAFMEHLLLTFQDVASQVMKKDVSSLRYIALPNWFHEAHMKSLNSDAQDACNADTPESSGIFNPTATLKILAADQMESLTVESVILLLVHLFQLLP